MQTSNTSTSNSNGTKPSSKGKNARFEGEVPGVAEKLGEKGISHERLVFTLSILSIQAPVLLEESVCANRLL